MDGERVDEKRARHEECALLMYLPPRGCAVPLFFVFLGLNFLAKYRGLYTSPSVKLGSYACKVQQTSLRPQLTLRLRSVSFSSSFATVAISNRLKRMLGRLGRSVSTDDERAGRHGLLSVACIDYIPAPPPRRRRRPPKHSNSRNMTPSPAPLHLMSLSRCIRLSGRSPQDLPLRACLPVSS